MTDDTTSTELTERLAALGRHPVDPATASQHLSAMAGVSLGRTGLRQKLQVAGALMAGIFIGGTGLATAGALGQSAEHRADKLVAAVTGQDTADEKKKKAGKGGDDDSTTEADREKSDSASTGNGEGCGQAVKAAVAEAREEFRADTTPEGNQGAAVSAAAKGANCGDEGDSDELDGTRSGKPADRTDNSGKGSENSGQGADKAAEAQQKGTEARESRSQNSGTSADDATDTDTVELDDDDDDDAESGARGAGRSGSGTGGGKGKPSDLPTP